MTALDLKPCPKCGRPASIKDSHHQHQAVGCWREDCAQKSIPYLCSRDAWGRNMNPLLRPGLRLITGDFHRGSFVTQKPAKTSHTPGCDSQMIDKGVRGK